MSGTDYEIRIKGRNELGLAVKQAERQLSSLANKGELLGKVLRGGAIVGAVVAFERLAENAEKAALAMGEKGTAHALHQLNAEIDTLKAKGMNVIGRVLGQVSIAAFGTETQKAINGLEWNIAELQKKLDGGLFGVVLWGPGGRAQAERDLAAMKKQLAGILADEATFTSRRAGAVSRGGGSGILTRYSSAFDAESTKAGSKSTGESEMDRYVAQLERQGEAMRHLQDTANDADKAIRENFAEGLEVAEGQLEQLTTTSQVAVSKMTVFADEAARNMQSSLSNFLFDPFADGLKGMAAGFADTIRRMVADLAAAEILNSFFSWGSGLGGGAGKFFSSIPHRAGGGPVSGGSAYLVGERGPEVFVPSASGTVMANGAGGGISLNYTIDARGADAERIMSVMPGLLKRTKDETIAEIRNLNVRGRL